MKLIKLIALAIIMMTCSFGYSQNMHVSGTVFDSTGTKPLKNALAMAIRISDQRLLGFTRTNALGQFVLEDFKVDTFSLIIDHPDFDEKIYYIFGNEGNSDITIPSVVMPAKSQEIEEVVIYAYKDPIYYKGDTLVYVADSFSVAEGAVVEDLLKKLPGISVDKDGKITSQGEEIGKVLVDGDEFFGSDPTIATKNLGADGIATVEIYEKENEDGIGGDDEKIKVLDLKLKESAKKGYFGRISGASDFALTPIDGVIGTNPFYEGELLLNKFDGAQKISIFALGSNTPRSSFGWGDMNKFGLENESTSGNRFDGGAKDNTSGVPQTLKAGIYYSDKFGKKKQTKFGANYSYYNDRLDASSLSTSEYFLTDTTYTTNDSIRKYTANQSHRLNLNLEIQLDSLTSIQIKPAVSFDTGLSDNSNYADYFGNTGLRSLGTEVRDSTSSVGYSASGFARINRKFMKKKRELELRYDLSLNSNESEGFLRSSTNYVVLDSNEFIRQNKLNNNATTSHYGTLTYVEPIGKKVKLEFEYLFEYGLSNQDKRAFNLNALNGLYDQTDSLLTNVFDNTRQQHRGGITFSFDPKKHSFSVTGKIRNIDIENVNASTGITVHQNFTNFLPSAQYMFRPSMSKRLRLTYKTSSQIPSINDLQPIPDNSNPNKIKEGNPNLVPNYNHSFNAMFNTWKALSGRYVWMGGNLNYTNKAFADSTSFDSYGRTVSKTVNVDGNVVAVVYSGAGLPILGRKITFEPGFNGSYFNFTNYISGIKSTTANFALTPALNIKFNLFGDSLEIETSSSYSFNNAQSSMTNTSSNYSIEKYGASFKWKLPHGFTISTEGTYTKNSQPGAGFYDTEYFVLNAQVSKFFLKTQNLELALKGNDILNQNINARREVSGNVITDYRTTIISRYFLLKMTLRFNNRKAKEEDFNGMH